MQNKIQLDTKTFIRFWLVILGLAAAGWLIVKASTGLIIIGAALFLALAISPLVNKLAKAIPGEGRILPIAIPYVLIVGFLTGFILIVIPTIVDESVKFVGTLPEVVSQATDGMSFIDDLGNSFGVENMKDEALKALGNFSTSFVKDFGSVLTNSISGIANIVSATILILVLAFFMLTEGPDLLDRFWGNFKKDPEAMRTQRVLDRMASVVAKYVSSAVTVSLINACATAITVSILSLIFNFSTGLSLSFGLITGVFSLIPMFGSFLGGCIVSLLLAFNNGSAGIAFMIYTIIYLQIESNILSPKIQGKGLQLPALAVLGSVTIGVYMFGLIGAIIAIPIAGCVKVLIEEYGGALTSTAKKELKSGDKSNEKSSDKKEQTSEEVHSKEVIAKS